jgi:hypothetical protein
MVTLISGHRLNCVRNERGHENVNYKLFNRHRPLLRNFLSKIRYSFLTTSIKSVKCVCKRFLQDVNVIVILYDLVSL